MHQTQAMEKNVRERREAKPEMEPVESHPLQAGLEIQVLETNGGEVGGEGGKGMDASTRFLPPAPCPNGRAWYSRIFAKNLLRFHLCGIATGYLEPCSSAHHGEVGG